MTKKVPAVKENTAVGPAAIDFSTDAGMGLEGADKDSFALPFVAILQGLSPQMETVAEAKIGHFINTITNKVSQSVDVVPVAFQRRYLAWQPRDEGGGFRGMRDVADVEAANYQRNEEGLLIDEDGNILKDTRIHYVLVVEPDGSFSPAIVSMASTQVKKSKRWLTLIQNVQMKDANGKQYNPPSFSHIYTLTSTKESNDAGTWYGFVVTMKAPVTDGVLYNAAKELNKKVRSGAVQASTPPEEEHQEASDKF